MRFFTAACCHIEKFYHSIRRGSRTISSGAAIQNSSGEVIFGVFRETDRYHQHVVSVLRFYAAAHSFSQYLGYREA